MKIVAIIPARMGSSRFPGKPLAKLAGLPMIEHVYRRTELCESVCEVHVATCDQEIMDAVERFGGNALRTSKVHERASDRVAEAALKIKADVYVMVQGDEPMITPGMIDLALKPIEEDPSVVCSNLVAPILSEAEFESRNTIKVAMDQNGNALYFSREAIPTRERLPFDRIQAFKQVCVIPFRRDFLLRFATLKPTPLEIIESIDMLRALEHGFRVRLVKTAHDTHAVDTPADLARVEILMRQDPLLERYAVSP